MLVAGYRNFRLVVGIKQGLCEESENPRSSLESRDRFVEKCRAKNSSLRAQGTSRRQKEEIYQMDQSRRLACRLVVVLCSSQKQLEVASGYLPFHDKLQEHLSAIKIMSWLDGTDHCSLLPRLLLSLRTRLAEILLSILSPSSILWRIYLILYYSTNRLDPLF